MDIQKLFAQCLREKQFLCGVSANHLTFLKYSFQAFHLEELTEAHLKQRIIELSQEKTPGCVNAYIRGISSFLSWCAENGHCPPIKLKALKQQQRVLKTFTDDQIQVFLKWRPKTLTEKRMKVLICLLLDTGMRISEALALNTDALDFGNLLIKIRGKGDKERLIPMSAELRKMLFTFIRDLDSPVLFATSTGLRWTKNGALKGFDRLCKRLGISGFEGAFHAFRRYYARNYVRQGGNLFYLQASLGHASLNMTRKYVQVETEDLQKMHVKTSPLSRLR